MAPLQQRKRQADDTIRAAFDTCEGFICVADTNTVPTLRSAKWFKSKRCAKPYPPPMRRRRVRAVASSRERTACQGKRRARVRNIRSSRWRRLPDPPVRRATAHRSSSVCCVLLATRRTQQTELYSGSTQGTHESVLNDLPRLFHHPMHNLTGGFDLLH